jgi:pilus assembly protein FimV
LAVAALAVFGAAAPEVQALGVGRLTVQSALGESMRAEIDISSLTPDEASSLVVRIASPEAYRVAGVDYNLVLAGAQAVVVRRDDGRSVLRLSSNRAVQEPFIELIVELNWASGRLVREFTLLFDPPGRRPAAPVPAAAAVAPRMAAAPVPMAAPATPPRPRPAPRSLAPAAPVSPVTPRTVAAAPAAPARAAVAGPGQYAVVPGDTLYGVAGETRPAGVSLDQMLVGLYRANPDAFIDNNVNKLRAGAVLSLPSADEVSDVTSSDMRRLISAQSIDFGAYRNRLAQGAPLAQAREPGRAAQGKVQAAVDDRKQSGAASPDKLKLSGAAASAAEAQIALAAERRENAARVADLTRNIEELKRLLQGATAAAPVATVAEASSAAPMPQPAASADVPAMTPEPAAAPAVTAAASRSAAVTPAALPAPAAEASGSFIDGLASSPWLLPGGVLALLLAGLAAWRLRSRMRKAASETSFLESRMQPDSFFGASGGQHVDTRDASRTSASSMGYSLSQLDAIGDVDPVAEADVYLAYGRDLQAEEILKEALRTTPERMAVRTKLLEVYAKRRDSKGFELLATQLYALTGGVGADWAKAQELGLQFDSDNPLYQPGGEPEAIVLDGDRVIVEPLGATTQPHSIFAPVTQSPEDSRLPQFGATGFDLDLDLGQPDPDPERAMDVTRPMASGAQRRVDPGLDFDFEDRATPAQRPDAPPAVAAPRTESTQLDSMRLDLDDGKGDTTVAGGPDSLLDFGSFPMSESGALADAVPTTPGHLDDTVFDQGDPLARKLELAEEFRQIGDIDGARDLLEEVVSKAAGTLRSKAQTMLDALG